jgi:hypothetical protein
MSGKLRHRLASAALVACLIPDAQAALTTWNKLSPLQREALAPLSSQWDQLPEPYQADMLKLTNHYERLTPEQKNRLHTRLLDWSRLTPQQRAQAREKYTAFQKVPPEKREMVKNMVKEQQAARNAPTDSSAPSPAPATK